MSLEAQLDARIKIWHADDPDRALEDPYRVLEDLADVRQSSQERELARVRILYTPQASPPSFLGSYLNQRSDGADALSFAFTWCLAQTSFTTKIGNGIQRRLMRVAD